MSENHKWGVSKGWSGETWTGIALDGVSRAEKWEMSGAPGGGRIRENSDARETGTGLVREQ